MTVGAAFKAIAEPNRREILRLAWNREMSASELASHFPMTRQAVSQHVRVLTSSGLLEERRDGTKRLYRTRQDQVGELQTYLDEFWRTGLEAIKEHAEDQPNE